MGEPAVFDHADRLTGEIGESFAAAGCLYFLRPSYGTVFLMYLSAPFVAVLGIAWFAGVQIAKRKKSPRL